MPFSIARPAASASPVDGTAPIPAISRSPSTRPPSPRVTVADVSVVSIPDDHRCGDDVRHPPRDAVASITAEIGSGTTRARMRGQHLDHRNLGAQLPRARRQLEPDETGSDDDDPHPRCEPRPQSDRIRQVSQIRDVRHLGTAESQATRRSSRWPTASARRPACRHRRSQRFAHRGQSASPECLRDARYPLPQGALRRRSALG